jgi:transposase
LRPVSSRLYGINTAEVIVAKAVCEITLGIDVAKHQLVIYRWDTQEHIALANEAAAIGAWLQGLAGPVRLAIEPTSNYHLTLVELAHAAAVRVYLVNPRQLAHYRDAVELRHKSDPDDAWLLARFLLNEGQQLRPFVPQSRQAQALWALIKRRAVVVESRQQLQQSLAQIQLAHRALMAQFKSLLARIDQRIKALIAELGWQADYRRCRSIPGIGPVNAAALVCAYHRGAFAGSDPFIAYLGLDIRRRESGRFTGQRKLTKRGEAELRRLLYCAAQPARCHPRFDRYYQAQLDKGHAKIAAKISLARKLARIAYTLMSKQQLFDKTEIAHSKAP